MIPKYIQIKKYDRLKYKEFLNNILDTNTVCISANCPNRYECFSKGTATFMILGSTCTRDCSYCNIAHGNPKTPLDEAQRITAHIKKMNLAYAVITSVTRDDLKDGGASHFASCVNAIRNECPDLKIELLIPDFQGNHESIKTIVDLNIDVINHNIEVVKRLYNLRPGADYSRSLELLKKVKKLKADQTTKSGLMIGLGETKQEIIETLNDLRNSGCNYLSIGQYIAPSSEHKQVEKYYKPKEFEDLKQAALDLGFDHVESGPLVRSSYHAKEYLETAPSN